MHIYYILLLSPWIFHGVLTVPVRIMTELVDKECCYNVLSKQVFGRKE